MDDTGAPQKCHFGLLLVTDWIKTISLSSSMSFYIRLGHFANPGPTHVRSMKKYLPAIKLCSFYFERLLLFIDLWMHVCQQLVCNYL